MFRAFLSLFCISRRVAVPNDPPQISGGYYIGKRLLCQATRNIFTAFSRSSFWENRQWLTAFALMGQSGIFSRQSISQIKTEIYNLIKFCNLECFGFPIFMQNLSYF
jgi:hypothetical protein